MLLSYQYAENILSEIERTADSELLEEMLSLATIWTLPLFRTFDLRLRGRFQKRTEANERNGNRDIRRRRR